MITIITPSYNKAQYIKDTIDTVIAQTFQDWELIIVDDGSSDNSIEIISNHIKNEPRIKLFCRERLPKGGSTCRNIGLEKSKGNLIIFLDSDDVLSKQCLEHRFKIMVESPELDFAVFPMGTFFEKIGDSGSVWLPTDRNNLARFLRHELPWSIMQPIWKKSFLMVLNGFDERFPRLQDVELHTRALLESEMRYCVIEMSSPDCYYRICENRIIENYLIFLSKWVEGSSLFIKTMVEKIEEIGIEKHKRKRWLRGTVLAIINQLLYRERQHQLTNTESILLIEKTLSEPCLNKLISPIFLHLFILLTKMGLYRVKGFNFLYKNLISL